MFIPAALAGLSVRLYNRKFSVICLGFGIILYLNFNNCISFICITVPTNKMSDDLKRSGGFIPGN
jgi:preprotein translocase subunit SecY